MKTTIDKVPLSNFIKKSKLLMLIESDISDVVKLPLVFSDAFIAVYQSRLSFVGVMNIKQLERRLSENAGLLKAFIIAWYLGPKENRRPLLPAGISIGFLCWLLALEQGGFHKLNQCVEKNAFTKNTDPTKLAKSFEIAYNEAKQTTEF